MTELTVSVPSAELYDALAGTEGVNLIEWDLTGPAPTSYIDIVVPAYWASAKRLANLEGVTTQLVQGQSIGFDPVSRHLPQGHRFANASSVHETSTAELAVAITLMGQRQLTELVKQGDSVTWADPNSSFTALADHRVLLVGYGGVGKAIDHRLGAFECEITRVATSERLEKGPNGETVTVFGLDRLHEFLRECDVVILAVPLNDTTEKLIDAEALALLPDNALVVNVARGKVVDTDALVAETQSGRLRAALDVTDPEPLPQGHPLWSLPNVTITPHVGGDSSAMMPRMVALIRRQVEALRAGQDPENVVIDRR